MFQTPNSRALMNAVPPGKQGDASGLLATGRVVGQSLSVALAGAIFAGLGGASAGRALAATWAGSVDSESIAALQRTFLTGFKSALMVCAAVAAAGVLATLIRGNEQRPASSDGKEGL
jgi:uncharacterized protein involved in outer membrane biogenesis